MAGRAMPLVHAVAAGWILLAFVDRRLGQSKSTPYGLPSWVAFWRRQKKTIVWIDGCYDMTHFGHFNAFRQAKALGDYLIVGLNPDSEVVRYKGSAPLFKEEERLQAIKACKWVDEVVENVPYVLDEKYLNEVVFGQYGVDYVVHGDDPCLDADGNDVFASSKKAGKYREIKRTEGVSTTDLVGRMLLMTRDHHSRETSPTTKSPGATSSSSDGRWGTSPSSPLKEKIGQSLGRVAGFAGFLPTSRRIAEFSAPVKRPEKGDRVVYVDGAFDLLLPCHIRFLEKARALGDFLIVGVHRDEEVNRYKGRNYPIMNLQERVLGVLSCRFVGEVIIGAPWEVTNDMITTFNISIVAHGSQYDATAGGRGDFDVAYKLPKEMGIFREILSTPDGGVAEIIERVLENRKEFEKKFNKKSAQENAYYEKKKYVHEG
eukprot:CAMPEP_0173378468 /NCGR_PEP_ID=MMETSP1356-20130122/1620_1 /TAXON_ID=77927 ORGANISM="Hemiselmis virescens, Strain PCC157" /NCGR_SAMPLE_ID=MMETSP1356 /ASSEMBLY_ACC=CAM_ASM_000847 /LENGTH=429 /DNA_ID=CAMNT_0014331543 /DNA_START=243 /DNA_END=1532 /DNA_ORIENTATION=+